MTTPSTQRKAGPLLGTGVQTSWPFTFKVFAEGDIAVTIADSLGVETALVLGADYSVSLNANQDTSPGGTVTYPLTGSPLPVGSKLTVVGDLDYDQPLDIPSGGNFSPVALENELDRIVMQVQQLRETISRSLLVPVTSNAAPALPNPEANQLISWDASGTTLQNVPISELATAVAYGTFRFDTFEGDGSTTQFPLTSDPAAIGNLDVAVDGLTMVPSTDYSLVASVLTFTVAPANGAEILARYGQSVPSVGGVDASAVTYQPSGAGAVATTVQTKLRRVEYSPEDCGAAETYNSAVDDRTFVQQAIDNLSAAGGGTLKLKRLYALNSFSSSYYTVKPKSNVNVVGDGPHTGFRVGNNLRSTSQGISVLYDHDNLVENVRFLNFSIDFNGANNLWLSGYGINANINRCGGNIARNFKMFDMSFSNAAGHHFVWFGLNSADSRNVNCAVVNCDFDECGLSISGNQVLDHSSIYMGSKRARVIGNRFTNANRDYVASAIEVHSDDTMVLGNIVYQYNHGCNFGGDSNTLTGLVISDNVFNSVVRGVIGYTYSTYTCNSITITDNIISVYDTEGTVYAAGGGVVYTGSLDTSTATSANWVITGNTITSAYTNTAAFTYTVTGIAVNGINGLTIDDNNISGLKGEGVRLEFDADKAHVNVSVCDNTIVGCGYTSASSRRQGIMALSGSVAPYATDVTISNNVVKAGHAGTATDMDYGIALNGTGQFEALRIKDNDISGTTIQDIYTPTAQTRTVKPLIKHVTSKDANPFNIPIYAGWGSKWVNQTNGYVYEFKNTAGTNGSSDGWNATAQASGDPNSTSPFNTVGTAWKRGDVVNVNLPSASSAHSYKCTASGTGGAAAVWKSEGNLAA